MPDARPLIQELKSSLERDGSSANMNRWTRTIIHEKIQLKDLSELILSEGKTGMRFSWLIGGFCDKFPHMVDPCISYFYAQRKKVRFKGFNRSLAKMFTLCQIPEEIEGEITSDLFNWLMDPKSDVSTKSFCLSALQKLSSKHKDLAQEFKIVVEDQLDKNTNAFRKKAEKVLASLRN
jgi:hypothetical protein